MSGSSAIGNAQALGWEGETGVFVTPLAYTAGVAGQKFHAVGAYHYFNAGSVIGDFHEASLEVGVGNYAEFGYTHQGHVTGENKALSELWQGGDDIFNAKVRVLPENFRKMAWVPQVSVGTMIRTNDKNVGDYLQWKRSSANGRNSEGTHNEDVYLAATKLITQVGKTKMPLPILLTGGIRGTNAELWGMGGNATDWMAAGFGSAAFLVKLPNKTGTLALAAEAAQQPSHPLQYSSNTPSASNLGGVKLNIPTTLTYAARYIPPTKHNLNFDFGIAQVAGEVAPGIDLKARHQVGVQMSYGF